MKHNLMVDLNKSMANASLENNAGTVLKMSRESARYYISYRVLPKWLRCNRGSNCVRKKVISFSYMAQTQPVSDKILEAYIIYAASKTHT